MTVKNVEVVNITGADNFATTSSKTETDSAVSGTAEVRSIQISSPAPEGEKVVFDFGDLVAAEGSKAGSEGISIAMKGGDTLTGIQIADGADGKAIATAVAAAINAADAEDADEDSFALATATVKGNTLVVSFPANDGENAAAFNPGDLSFAVLDADGEVENTTFVQTNITKALVDASTTAAVVKPAVSVEINGTSYDLGTVTIDPAKYYASVDDGDGASEAAKDALERVNVANAVRDLVKAKVNEILGSTITATDGDENGELLVTSSALGVAAPTITVAQTTTETALSAVDSDDTQAKAAVSKTLATGAVAERQSLDLSDLVPGDSLEMFIGGASYGTLTIATSDDSATILATEVAASINSALGKDSAIAVGETVTITALEAGTALPNITFKNSNPYGVAESAAANAEASYKSDAAVAYVNAKAKAIGLVIAGAEEGKDFNAEDALTAAEALKINAQEWSTSIVRQNATDLTSTTTVTATASTVSGASFVGAEQVWLVGADSNDTNLTVSGAQVAGLNKVTGIDGQTYTLGTASTLAISGATTATDKTANVKGGGTTLNIIGSGTSGFALTETNTVDKMDTLAVNTSGTTTLTVSGLSALESVTQSGEGGLVLTSGGLESITTGAGADKVTASLKTVEDNANTAADETKSSVVSTGDGADVVVVSTTGTGSTTVETGAGNDTVKVTSMGSGDNLVELGDGNDTAWLASGLSNVSSTNVVDAGDGVDTLDITGKDTFTAGDYTRYKTGALNFEKVIFTGEAGKTTAIDASKFAGIQSFQFNGGSSNQIEEVSGAIILGSQAPTGVNIGGTDYLGDRANAAATGITASSLGYELDSDTTTTGNQTVYGGDLSITVAGFGLGESASVVANAANTTVTAVAVAGSTALKIANSAPVVTLTGDTQTATFVLSSTRVVSTTAGTEVMAGVKINLDGAGDDDITLNALESITVLGAGTVDIDVSETNAAKEELSEELVSINLAGMTAFANLDKDGDNEGGDFGYNNASTSKVTLNDNVVETVTLGGAKDNVITGSNVEFTDSIVGFQLVATADTTDDDAKVDTDVSDSIDITGADHTVVADDTDYASLDAALLALSATKDKKAAFHTEGNTYIYVNGDNTELDDADQLIELVGTYDLDQLVTVVG